MCNRALRNLVVVTVFSLLFFTPFAFADHSVNINTADKESLKTLKGIGDVIAQRIIDYRTQYGDFKTIDEIKDVSGIGDKTFDDIKDHITVELSTSTNPPPTSSTEQASYNSSPQDVITSEIKTISAYAGNDRIVFAGADALFEGEAFGLQQEPLESARYIWTFGNGDRREGKTFFYNFPYPGSYVVVLDVVSGKYSASDRMNVTVVPAKLAIGEVTAEFIEVANHTDVEIDLGGWMLLVNTVYFRFPQHTIILAGESVRISNARTGLSPSSKKEVSILYPNGTPAVVYEEPLIMSRKQIATTPVTSNPVSAQKASASSSQIEIAEAQNDSTPNTPQLATPSASLEKKNTVLPWLMSIFGIALVAMAGVFFVRRKRYSEYEIQEIE